MRQWLENIIIDFLSAMVIIVLMPVVIIFGIYEKYKMKGKIK
jgi:hypothetical protein